ncbi:MAG: alpha/beta hydrolase [Opitutales bacterium]
MVNTSEFSIPLWEHTPPLWTDYSEGDYPSLELKIKEDSSPRPLVLLFPSGGYHHLDVDPVFPIAESMLGLDCHVGILKYRTQQSLCGETLYDGPLLDAQRAFRLIRRYATKWNVLPESLIALGFGAGAHLAACAAVHANWRAPEYDDSYVQYSGSPNAMALGHPIVSNHTAHQHIPLERVLGPSPSEPRRSFYQLEHRVTPVTPRTFLWHTLEDPQNPAHDSFRFAQALSAQNVDCELHIFNRGEHAIDWNEGNTAASQWKSLFLSWLARTLPKLNQSASLGLDPKAL